MFSLAAPSPIDSPCGVSTPTVPTPAAFEEDVMPPPQPPAECVVLAGDILDVDAALAWPWASADGMVTLANTLLERAGHTTRIPAREEVPRRQHIRVHLRSHDTTTTLCCEVHALTSLHASDAITMARIRESPAIELSVRVKFETLWRSLCNNALQALAAFVELEERTKTDRRQGWLGRQALDVGNLHSRIERLDTLSSSVGCAPSIRQEFDALVQRAKAANVDYYPPLRLDLPAYLRCNKPTFHITFPGGEKLTTTDATYFELMHTVRHTPLRPEADATVTIIYQGCHYVVGIPGKVRAETLPPNCRMAPPKRPIDDTPTAEEPPRKKSAPIATATAATAPSTPSDAAS